MITRIMTPENKRDAELREVHRILLKHGLKTFEVTDSGYKATGPMSIIFRDVGDGE